MTSLKYAVAAFALMAAPVDPAAAQSGAQLPANRQVVRVEQDKAGYLRFQTGIGVVMVANPEIADVVVEQKRIVFVLGKKPGETSLIVMDESGRSVLETNIVVVPTESRSVTLMRGTAQIEHSCAPRCVSQAPDKGGGSVQVSATAVGPGAGKSPAGAPGAGASPEPQPGPPAR